MIANISLFTLYVTDQDEAKKFYVDVLGSRSAPMSSWVTGFGGSRSVIRLSPSSTCT
jgi:predicted enzyme related to lactoylglutathione lyase